MNDAERIFDAIGKVSQIVICKDEINHIESEIFELNKKVCGHCDKWMKSTCIPEKQHKQFKSCNSLACKDFVKVFYLDELINKKQKKIKELKTKLEARP
jgi:hypothetical protein